MLARLTWVMLTQLHVCAAASTGPGHCLKTIYIYGSGSMLLQSVQAPHYNAIQLYSLVIPAVIDPARDLTIMS